MICDAREPVAGCARSEAESNQSLRMMLLRAGHKIWEGAPVTGYQGSSIGTYKSSGHRAIPAPHQRSLVDPGTTFYSSSPQLLSSLGRRWTGCLSLKAFRDNPRQPTLSRLGTRAASAVPLTDD